MSFDYLKFAFSAGELSPDLHGRGDLDNFEFGFREGENVFVDWRGSVKSRPGTEFCDALLDQLGGYRLHNFSFNAEPEDNYLLVFTNKKLRFMQDGLYVTDDIGARIGAAYSRMDSVFDPYDWISFFDDFFQHSFTLMYNGTDQYRGFYPYGDNTSILLNGDRGLKVYDIETPYKGDDLQDLRFSQFRDEIIITHPEYAVRKLVRKGHANWTIEKIDFLKERAQVPITTDAVVGERPTRHGGDNEGYVAFGISAVFGEEDSAIEGKIGKRIQSGRVNIATHFVTLNWARVEGASGYHIYATDLLPDRKNLEGRGMGRISGEKPIKGTSFVYDHIAPNVDETPLVPENPFSSVFPRTSALYAQRRLYASTNTKPSTIFSSSLRSHDDFTFGARDDQAFEFAIDSTEVNAVNDIIATYRGLFLFSQKAIWLLRGADDSVLSPSTAVNENEQETGAYPIPRPFKVLDSILYVSTLDDTVRGLLPTSTPNFFETKDLGLFSNHLFTPQITSWAYAGRKDRILWAIRKDGKLLSMTFAPEHSVNAWCKHSTAGQFKDVAVVSEKDVDRVYFIVERNGAKFIERFSNYEVSFIEQSCPVDAAVRYQGRSLNGAVRIGTRITKTGVHPMRQTGATSIFSSGYSDGFLKTQNPPSGLRLYNKANKQRLSAIDASQDTLVITPAGKYRITGGRDSDGYFPCEIIVEDKANLIVANTLREFEANEVKVARPGVLPNLQHLKGFDVRCIEFNASAPGRVTVLDMPAFNAITQAHGAGEFTIGIPFNSRLTTLPFVAPNTVVEDKPKRSYSVSVRLEKSSSVMVGVRDNLYPTMVDENGNPVRSLETGISEVLVGDSWDSDNFFIIASEYPFRLLGLIINYDFGDETQQEEA